ncbi:hypothetical protein PO909_032284 [Leuciscus waleckii]
MEDALKSMKRGKSPGTDGLSVEFYLHFWDILKQPLHNLFIDCIKKGEMTSSMKQGLISLIPKTDKDPLLIENWRPISLLNVDYKLLALILAVRLKSGLNSIIGETQNGFMKNRHISSNIRLVLDLIDYSENIDSEAIIMFLDFYKAFDSLEHQFLLKSLSLFGFGSTFINMVSMLYNDINSSVLVGLQTTKRFNCDRGVRQGCPISPFLFLLAVELLSIVILQNPSLEGISIFSKEFKISQLADDTTIFLKDQSQIPLCINIINSFSEASGLYLNVSKCELFCLYDTQQSMLHNIPVKDCIKYLGIFLTKDRLLRQQLNFSPKIKKTRTIFNLWLQRDLSIYGRVLISKAEGLSRCVYPSLSLFVSDKICDDINKILLNFIWKNKSHYIKKENICRSKIEGGLNALDFKTSNTIFKIKRLQNYKKKINKVYGIQYLILYFKK